MCDRFAGKIGWQGQRYEVSAHVKGFTDERKVIGWTDAEDGGALVKMINLHPGYDGPRVYDAPGWLQQQS